jgi:hypothetical protein
MRCGAAGERGWGDCRVTGEDPALMDDDGWVSWRRRGGYWVDLGRERRGEGAAPLTPYTSLCFSLFFSGGVHLSRGVLGWRWPWPGLDLALVICPSAGPLAACGVVCGRALDSSLVASPHPSCRGPRYATGVAPAPWCVVRWIPSVFDYCTAYAHQRSSHPGIQLHANALTRTTVLRAA